MMTRRVLPTEIKLLHEGKEHSLSLARGVDRLWDIKLDGDLWAYARRIKQGEWYVYRSGQKQRGKTLETAATTMFYRHMKDLG